MSSEVAGEVGEVHLGQPRPAGRRWLPAGAIAWTAVGVGAAAWLWHSVAVLRSYFFQDDFVLLYNAAHTGLTPGYLVHPHNGNVMPLPFLLVWLVTRIAPLNHTVAVVPLIVLAGVALVVMWSCLVTMCGRRWALLVPFTAFALSPAVFSPTAWWAYSLEFTPLLVAMLAAVRAQLKFVRTGTSGHALAALGWTAVGLLCWDKAVLIPVVVFGLTLVLAPRTVRPYWKLWLGYVVLLGLYAALYLVVTWHDSGTVPVRAGDIPSLAGIMVGRTFLPGLLGGPWTVSGTSWAVGSRLLLAITWGITAVVVVAGLRTGRGRAALAVVLGYLAADVALVAAGRLGAIGALIGSDPRYTADAVPVVLLCGSAALLTEPVRFPRGGALGLSAAVAASAVITLVGPPYVSTTVARQYVTTASRTDAVLYDGRVPSQVMLSWFGSLDRVSVVLGALPNPPTFDQPTGDLRMLDDTGTPRSIVLFGAATGPPGPVADCGYAVTSRPTDIALTTPAHGDKPVVRIGYYAGSGGAGSVDLGHGAVNVAFSAGVHDLFLVADGPPAAVRITASSGTVCVTDVAVGMPLPAGR